jgi:phage shock protein C
MSNDDKPKRLYRSRKEKMIAGVCGGLADYFDLDPSLVRIIYVLVSIFSVAFPGILVYIVLWIIIPESEG